LAESISERKRSHLELCEAGPVEFAGKTTLLEQVDLVHDALPELAVDEVDVGTELLGKRLRAPLLISGMTGGTDEASAINRALAQVAEEYGIGFGLGSQRAMQRTPDLAYTFEVGRTRRRRWSWRIWASCRRPPRRRPPSSASRARSGADAVCIHLNPAQEMIQPGGDRDFRHGVETLARLARELPLPVVAKETGCGISRRVGERLLGAGIRTADVSGAGGTSWVKVETLRAGGPAREIGEQFADWGIPTAAALLGLRGLGLDLIASGGIRTGLDVAKAVALGARAAGVALPVFRALQRGGRQGAAEFIEGLVSGLRTAMVLTGSRDLNALRRVPVVTGPQLTAWVKAEGGA
jgi:isopentenyl-diphosphate delta-isomerase